MGESLLLDMEGGRKREDRLPVLDGDDAPCREAAPVPYPVHLIDEGRGGIAAEQEIGMEGMGTARTIDGLPSRRAAPG